MAYYGRSFPSGNYYEFPLIDAQLLKRGIIAEYSQLPTGGRLYRWDESENHKLPLDGKVPYLPVTDDEGHTIWKWNDDFSEEAWRLESRGSEWTAVKK